MGMDGQGIIFQVRGKDVHGYLSMPRGEGPFPGLIVVHEWWGLNNHIKDIADRFADRGYVALAPDLYDGKVTSDPTEAARYMQELDQKKSVETLSSAIAYLQAHRNVRSDKIGITGFCMGGSFALLLACLDKNIKASAPFYGDVPSDDLLENLNAPILFIGAENDFWITKDKIDRLREALKMYGKKGEVKVYSGVGHAFLNDTRPEAYDKEAAEDAWNRVNKFFEQELK